MKTRALKVRRICKKLKTLLCPLMNMWEVRNLQLCMYLLCDEKAFLFQKRPSQGVLHFMVKQHLHRHSCEK